MSTFHYEFFIVQFATDLEKHGLQPTLIFSKTVVRNVCFTIVNAEGSESPDVMEFKESFARLEWRKSSWK